MLLAVLHFKVKVILGTLFQFMNNAQSEFHWHNNDKKEHLRGEMHFRFVFRSNNFQINTM